MEIKVGILISYDYVYAYKCIERIYNAADRIVLAVDKDHRTWAGEKFEIDPLFFNKVKANDPKNKIEIYRGDFYDPSLSTIENETRERNMLAEYMGRESGWHLQVDSDEYFVDFDGFVKYLHVIEKKIGKRGKVVVKPVFLTLVKQDENGFYLTGIDNDFFVSVATNDPHYKYARSNSNPKIKVINTKFYVLHQSWAREEKEIEFKLSNWGHSQDFDCAEYFQFWRSINKYNAPYIKDFHPIPSIKNDWPSMKFIEGSIDQVIDSFKMNYDKVLIESKKTARRYRYERSLFYRGLRKLYNKINQR